jgi:exosortase
MARLIIARAYQIRLLPAFTVLGVIIAALWAHWPTLAELDRRWTREPLYSHGYLIPVIAVGLLWWRRDKFRATGMQASAWGIPFLLLATAMRLTGDYFYLFATDRFSMLLVSIGVCLVLGGWQALRWAWPAIAYLLFMLPLPGRFTELLANSLQRVAVLASTNVLQTLGFPAQVEGNVIILSQVELGVVEACSGIRMLVVFCAIATAVALVIPRSWPQRLLIILSAIPTALVCNISRIVLTGVLYEMVSDKAAELLFHDLAGLFMALVASGLLWIELHFLSRLFVPAHPDESFAKELLLGRTEGSHTPASPSPSRFGSVGRLVGLGKK